MTDSNYQFATSSSQIGSSLPVEMLEAAAQALIVFDGEHPSAPWEFYAEAALKAAGVPALLAKSGRVEELEAALRDVVETNAALRGALSRMVGPCEEALRNLDPHEGCGYDTYAKTWDALRAVLYEAQAVVLASLPAVQVQPPLLASLPVREETNQ